MNGESPAASGQPVADSRRVVESLDSIDVVLQARGGFHRYGERIPDSWTLRFAHRWSPVIQERDNEFAFLIGFLCEAVLPIGHEDADPQYPDSQISGASDKVLFNCEADFILKYRLRPGTSVTAEELEAFAQSNGVFNAQPFWREFLMSSALRAQSTAIIAPVVRVNNGSLPPDGTVVKGNSE